MLINQMDNLWSINEQKLKRLPALLVFILILTLSLPAIVMYCLGLDFTTMPATIDYLDQKNPSFAEIQMHAYFQQMLLQWTAFFLSVMTVLLSFTQFRLANDKIALVIGLAVLFSGMMEALNLLLIDGVSSYLIDKTNLDAVIWTVSNAVSGLIFLIGLTLVLKDKNQNQIRLRTVFILSFTVLLLAAGLFYLAAKIIPPPQMFFESAIFSRPFELIYLFIYLFIILFIYPKIYQKHPYILTNCIFYMAVAQIILAIYLLLWASLPYNAVYNVAYFLKIIIYFIPFSCLIINYIFAYNAMLEPQGKLKYIAAHDPLTNLYNRREFEDLLGKTIANSVRSHASFALFVIDLDDFKAINDTLGHSYGDKFLKHFASQLTLLSRKGDIVSRIGGDEFTLIASKLKSHAAAKKLAERLVSGINSPYSIPGKCSTNTVSIGISIYPRDGKTAEELLKNADTAMYNVKKTGKNTYQFYTKKLTRLKNRGAEIEHHLRDALKNDEFALHYQPKFSLDTKEIIGAEVLLRWKNPKLGSIPPDEFIPVAENSGLIINIGNWVLSKTCEQAAQWYDQYQKYLLFSINVSPVQFEDNMLYNTIKKILKICSYPAEYLDIEVNENLLIKPDEFILSELKKINKLGVNISIDNFSIGYSSLNRLRSLPINSLKIDRLFISDIHNKFDKVVVIDAIIKLAHELGMDVIAEAIETKEELDYLIARKCSLGQGFLLSKPLSAKKFERLAYARVC